MRKLSVEERSELRSIGANRLPEQTGSQSETEWRSKEGFQWARRFVSGQADL